MILALFLLLLSAIDPAAVNDGTQTGKVGPNAKGAAVLRAQILLDRAHFSPGQIDSSYGRNLGAAIAAYRAAHGLTPGDTVDEEMWKLMNTDSAPALTEYTISDADVAGPFAKVPADMKEKAKLKRLGYESPLDGLAEKFHSAPGLVESLNPGKKFDQAGVPLTVPNVITAPLADKAVSIVVNGEQRTVTALDAAGKVLASFPATIGSEHDPLPAGSWKIVGVSRNPVFNYNSDLFWDAQGEHAEAKIAPGPRNPVGVVWIGLSKEHYGIHGTPEPGLIGHTASHGCIRLTNWDATELAGMVSTGTPAILEER